MVQMKPKWRFPLSLSPGPAPVWQEGVDRPRATGQPGAKLAERRRVLGDGEPAHAT